MEKKHTAGKAETSATPLDVSAMLVVAPNKRGNQSIGGAGGGLGPKEVCHFFVTSLCLEKAGEKAVQVY